jgi:hypothetical protein
MSQNEKPAPDSLNQAILQALQRLGRPVDAYEMLEDAELLAFVRHKYHVAQDEKDPRAVYAYRLSTALSSLFRHNRVKRSLAYAEGLGSRFRYAAKPTEEEPASKTSAVTLTAEGAGRASLTCRVAREEKAVVIEVKGLIIRITEK